MRLHVDEEFEADIFPIRLKSQGYTTLMAGKYLNGMAVSHCPTPGNSTPTPPPPGWDRYFAMCPDTCYTDCFFSDDGVGKTFSDPKFKNGSNYAPSLVGNVSVDFLGCRGFSIWILLLTCSL